MQSKARELSDKFKEDKISYIEFKKIIKELKMNFTQIEMDYLLSKMYNNDGKGLDNLNLSILMNLLNHNEENKQESNENCAKQPVKVLDDDNCENPKGDNKSDKQKESV